MELFSIFFNAGVNVTRTQPRACVPCVPPPPGSQTLKSGWILPRPPRRNRRCCRLDCRRRHRRHRAETRHFSTPTGKRENIKKKPEGNNQTWLIVSLSPLHIYYSYYIPFACFFVSFILSFFLHFSYSSSSGGLFSLRWLVVIGFSSPFFQSTKKMGTKSSARKTDFNSEDSS